MNIRQLLRHLSFLLCGVVLTGSLVGASLGEAATYYTATSGTDANPGTEAKPFRTVTRGVQGLQPGDTLYVKSGTYAEALGKIPGGSSWSAPVTVAAYPGHTVTLKPSGSSFVLSFEGSNRKYIIVEGFSLDASQITGNGVVIGSTSSAGSAHHIRLKNSEVKNAPHNGVSVKKGSNYNEFINLDVHHNGLNMSASTAPHGMYLHSAHNLIEHSRIHDNNNSGVNFRDDVGGVDYLVFRYNKVYNNGRNPLVGKPGASAHGLYIGAGTGALVYNNLFWDNPGAGIFVGGGEVGPKVYNNTVYSNSSHGIYVSTATNAQIKNNISYGNGKINIFNEKGTGTVLANNLTTNPLFADAAERNFKLQATSPAIDAGTTLSEVKDDHVKVRRPQGDRYDIGAYEYTTGKQLAAPTQLRIIEAN